MKGRETHREVKTVSGLVLFNRPLTGQSSLSTLISTSENNEFQVTHQVHIPSIAVAELFLLCFKLNNGSDSVTLEWIRSSLTSVEKPSGIES